MLKIINVPEDSKPDKLILQKSLALEQLSYLSSLSPEDDPPSGSKLFSFEQKSIDSLQESLKIVNQMLTMLGEL